MSKIVWYFVLKLNCRNKIIIIIIFKMKDYIITIHSIQGMLDFKQSLLLYAISNLIRFQSISAKLCARITKCAAPPSFRAAVKTHNVRGRMKV